MENGKEPQEFEYRDIPLEEVQELIKQGKVKVDDTVRLEDHPNRKVSVKFYNTPRNIK